MVLVLLSAAHAQTLSFTFVLYYYDYDLISVIWMTGHNIELQVITPLMLLLPAVKQKMLKVLEMLEQISLVEVFIDQLPVN